MPSHQNVILIATGTGFSPYMSIIRTQVMSGITHRIAVIHGARHSWDLAYHSELITLQRLSLQFNYLPVISLEDEEIASWKGYTGFIHDLWKTNVMEKIWKFHPTPNNTHIFLCGHPLMIKAMLELLVNEGFQEHAENFPGQIHLERFF